MSEEMIEVGEGFWNIRGSFRIGGILNVGTQCSLVRLNSGGFVLLDAYTLPESILAKVRALTDGGQAVQAVLNLHPFHTLHVGAAHQQFPKAALYGSSRHVEKAPELPWQALRMDDPELHARFAPDLEFSVPSGVHFIHNDPDVHFSSVLAYHPSSKTIHVDDTFNHMNLPLIGGVSLHPTLSKALIREPGAAEAFQEWASALIDRWSEARNLCAAHTSALLNQNNLAEQMRAALHKVDGKLQRHSAEHG
ncbi:MAG: hypothetical protein ACI9VR_004183 [Cognaticolwellia sp.]|jgi:hypothetical protein